MLSTAICAVLYYLQLYWVLLCNVYYPLYFSFSSFLLCPLTGPVLASPNDTIVIAVIRVSCSSPRAPAFNYHVGTKALCTSRCECGHHSQI